MNSRFGSRFVSAFAGASCLIESIADYFHRYPPTSVVLLAGSVIGVWLARAARAEERARPMRIGPSSTGRVD